MKKYLLFLSFLCLTGQYYAQSLYVEYEHTVNVVKETGTFNINAILISEGNLSHYTVFFNNEEFKNIPKVTQDENEDTTYHLFTSVDVGNTSKLIYDKSDNSISQDFLDNGKPTIIKDEGVMFDWKLSEETKIIQNFKCTKATVDFRGRKFVAWFTTEIPVSFGPWKFHGLPGLILQVYDVDNLFEWRARKVQYPVLLDQPLTSVHLGDNHRIMSLRGYLEEQTKKRHEVEKIRNSKLPKGTKIVESKTQNNGIELVYEWEIDKDKKN